MPTCTHIQKHISQKEINILFIIIGVNVFLILDDEYKNNSSENHYQTWFNKSIWQQREIDIYILSSKWCFPNITKKWPKLWLKIDSPCELWLEEDIFYSNAMVDSEPFLKVTLKIAFYNH